MTSFLRALLLYEEGMTLPETVRFYEEGMKSMIVVVELDVGIFSEDEILERLF
jgi:hypothetical protein